MQVWLLIHLYKLYFETDAGASGSALVGQDMRGVYVKDWHELSLLVRGEEVCRSASGVMNKDDKVLICGVPILETLRQEYDKGIEMIIAQVIVEEPKKP